MNIFEVIKNIRHGQVYRSSKHSIFIEEGKIIIMDKRSHYCVELDSADKYKLSERGYL